jgi:Rieske 2Fe-2S family protein
MSKQVSRRDFARTSAAAAGAALAVPAALLDPGALSAKTSAAAAGAAAARRRLLSLPPEVAYGGINSEGRDVRLEDTLTSSGQPAPEYPGGWREGTTIPAEYYVDERHYLNDERVIAENFWLMADHESRIPKAGDYFVFEFGRGDSLIILRDQAGAVKAYHNVCRHRGSRLCLHGTGFDNVRPDEAKPDGRPTDVKLSVVQLGSSGSTRVFRCPYHAWTYDLDGKLISFPPGMPSGFDATQHGLHPAHARTVEGFIFISLARQAPPDFDSFVANWRTVAKVYGAAQLKVAARRQYPTKANWKLAIENFRECYHCEASHKHLVRVQWWQALSTTPEQRTRIEQDLARHGHPEPPRRGAGQGQGSPQDRLVEPAAAGMGMAGTGRHLSPGYVTGSMDGKPVAPLLLKEWTHRRGGATTGFSTSFFAAYDDHLAVARFTPRDVMRTDVELFWLVRGDAKEKDVDVDRLIGLWDTTYREDRWIVENNQHGIMSTRYSYAGGQPYASSEGGPAGFIKWYMSEVAPRASAKPTNAG